ncbi:MAG: succinoglycan biosynthesis protein ExoV [Paraglaciecola sp.]
MELGFFEGNISNVGDDLNPFLWSGLLPGLGGGDCSTVFIGIGSILDRRYDHYDNKVVFGSGARGTETLPDIDDSWNIRFVRGPLTCNALKEKGINVKYITDPAMLVSKFFTKPQVSTGQIGLIPYFRTDHKPWAEIAKSLGYKLISPTLSVEDFVNELSQCSLVVTEAMHGAIIADALRVPWIPYSSFTIAHEQDTHLFKWTDWCSSVGLEFEDFVLPRFWPSTQLSFIGKLKNYIKKRYIAKKISLRVNNGVSYLSNDKIFAEKIRLLEEEVETMKKYLDYPE